MTDKEIEVLEFARDFMVMMNWKNIDIIRIKINRMERAKGWCIPDTQSNGIYILLSEKTNEDNKDFFATLIHELIHAHLLNKKWKLAHKHGKHFKRLAKKVEKKTNGFYTAKEII